MKVRVASIAGVVSALSGTAWAWLSSDWEPERARAIAVALGWVAAVWLVATLGASLVKRWRPWRRALGITTAWLSAIHLAASLSGPLNRAWTAAWSWPRYRAGMVALVLLLVLFATSFPKWVRVREWKALHRLVYPAALLVVAHVAQLSMAWLALALAGTVAILLVLRLRLQK